MQTQTAPLFAPFARLRAWAYLGALDDLVAQLDRWERAALADPRAWVAIADEIHHEANGWDPYASVVAYQLRDCEAAIRALTPRPDIRVLRVTPTCTSWIGGAASRAYAEQWADECAARTGACYVVSEDGREVYTTAGGRAS